MPLGLPEDVGPTLISGVKRAHLIDAKASAAACKAVYAGSIPTPASNSSRDSGERDDRPAKR